MNFFLLSFTLLQLGIASVSTEEPQTPSGACWNEIQKIDRQVEKLSQEKQKHIDLARQYQERGDNWLYSSGSIQDGYHNWALADQERKAAASIQHEIDVLLQRKQRIYQFYPELFLP